MISTSSVTLQATLGTVAATGLSVNLAAGTTYYFGVRGGAANAEAGYGSGAAASPAWGTVSNSFERIRFASGLSSAGSTIQSLNTLTPALTVQTGTD